jgi:hypothetical protein
MQINDQPKFQVAPVMTNGSLNISEYETSWRSKFPKLIVLILSIIQIIFTIIIFLLEIASLAIFTYQPTGVGIWSAIPFLTASILTFRLGEYILFLFNNQYFILVRKKDASRRWATIVLIAQLVLLVFTFILIGITGNFIQTGGYSSYDMNIYGIPISYIPNSYITKYKLIQAQLAFGILLMFSVFTYIGIYIYVTYVALWQPYHTIDTGHLFHE